MISTKLVNGPGNGFFLFRFLVLSYDDRDTIDKEDHVGPIRELPVRIRPLLGRVKVVALKILEINQPDIPFTSLRRNIDGFPATKPLQRLLVPLDGVAKILKGPDYFADILSRDDIAIEFLQLLFEDRIEEESRLTVTEP